MSTGFQRMLGRCCSTESRELFRLQVPLLITPSDYGTDGVFLDMRPQHAMLSSVMDSSQLVIPKLNRLPETWLRDGAVQLELEQGIVIFRASAAVQTRIAKLLDKQRSNTLTETEERELTDYEEVDDYLSHVNRLIRNLSQSSEDNLAA
jgi:hypothetical protein